MTPPLPQLTRAKKTSDPSPRARLALGGNLAGAPEPSRPQPDEQDSEGQPAASGRRWPWQRSSTPAQEPGAGGARWAGGAALAAKAMTAGLLVAVVAGPVALVMQLSSSDPVVLTQAAPAAGSSSTASTLAGERGLQTVRSWLASTADNPRLDAGGTWPKTASPATSLRVAQVSGTGDPATFEVLVAASIKNREHFFEVPVRADEQRATALALPAVAPAPAPGQEPGTGYGQRGVELSSPAAQTVQEFLSAYLTGKSTTRMTSPGVELTSVKASPWTAVKLTSLDAQVASGQDVTAAPADGEVAQVRADYVMTRAGERSTGLSSQIALTMTARAGRWEITSVDPAPLVDPTSSSPAGGEETSPQGDTTQGENS